VKRTCGTSFILHITDLFSRSRSINRTFIDWKRLIKQITSASDTGITPNRSYCKIYGKITDFRLCLKVLMVLKCVLWKP